MNPIYKYTLILWIFGIILCFNSNLVSAHGTAHRLLTDTNAVTVEFFYSDNEPMSYSEILVFSPRDQKLEYQNGRTDQKGRFSIYPEIPGTWKIIANDGMGHKETATIQIQEDIAETPGGQMGRTVQAEGDGYLSRLSTAVKTVAGLSLILNVFLVLHLWKRNGFSRKE